MMRVLKPSLSPLLLLLLLSPVSTASRIEVFKDFSSKGPDYKPLESILLKADDIRFEGVSEASAYGKSYPASVFALTATVRLQTMCAFGAPELNTYDNVLADYKIEIVADNDKSIHDAFVEEIVSMSNIKDSQTYDLPFNRHLLWEDGNYVLYISPRSELVGDAFILWADGKYIKATFTGFRKGAGLGVVSSFFEQSLRFRMSGKEIVPDRWSAKNCKEFLKLHKRGMFKKS